jgi:hypothetical protein
MSWRSAGNRSPGWSAQPAKAIGTRPSTLGYLQIPKAGEYTVSIRPAQDADRYLMYFQSLQFRSLRTQFLGQFERYSGLYHS